MNRLAALALLLLAACNTSEPEPTIVLDLGPRANLLQACENTGDMVACANLALDYQNGTNGDVNVEGAKRLYKKACDGQVIGACLNLGVLVKAEDPEGAVRLFTMACNDETEDLLKPGCTNAGDLLAQGKVPDQGEAEAIPLYLRACDHNDGPGCYNAGGLIGDGTPAPRGETKEGLWSKACALGVARACP